MLDFDSPRNDHSNWEMIAWTDAIPPPFHRRSTMSHALDYNPHLALLGHARGDRDVGKGSIERPEDARNIPWQTRASLPTDYENRLGDALERIFESGATDLQAVVAGLNTAGLRSADGREWTATLFEEEMRRLGNHAGGRAHS
jgi:hypothetical protein